MAEAVLAAFIEYHKKLLAVFIEHYKKALLRQLGINPLLEEVQDEQEKLRLWLPVLKDLDSRKSKDSRVYDLERDIRDLVCRLQDNLETYSHVIQPRRGSSIKNYLREIVRYIYDSRSFSTVHLDVKEINARITSTYDVLKCLKVLAVTNIEEERSHSVNENREPENRQNFRYRKTLSREEHIVGMNDELITLKSILVDGEHRVICIYGMDGIGKTTLALKLYDDTSVQDCFDICAWVKMGQDITMEDVLENMLNQLPGGADKIKYSGRELETLAEHVYKSLKGRRHLVVLDDIWSLDSWDFLRIVFPKDQNGSKLMFTTRLREVAKYVAGDDRNGLIHAMKYLSISESSELFWKTAFRGTANEVDSFKKQIVEEVLKVCKGLPSAIVAVGEVLATKHTLREWEMVLQDAKSLMSRGILVDQNVLEQSTSPSSFDDLPYKLKPCFLYLGLFPKGSKIEVEHLYLLWMADGMISLDDCQSIGTIMDLAELYLSELVERKMVDVEEDETPSFRKYKSCWVHEHMQDHCLRKGEDYFFKVLDFGLRTQRRADSYSFSSISNPARRMALYLGKQDDRSSFDQFRDEIVNHLRSLLILNPHDLHMKLEWLRRMFDLKKYRMLRVLKFERVDFQERGLPRGMTRLIYLRYLSFKGCILGVLPSSIGKLLLLEVLDLRVSSPMIIPNVLWKIKKLRHLYLPLIIQTPYKLNLASLKELEILENFDTRVCNVADLFEMTSLRHLSMTVEGISEDLEQIVHWLDMTSEQVNVLYTSIKVKKFDCYTEARHSVFRKLLNCQILHTLYMDGHLEQLPPHYSITSSLTEMVLIGSELKEDPMKTLGNLPELQVLVLQDDAFVGKKMRCVKSSFKKLKRLEILTLRSLESWEVQKNSMPMLSILAVKNCRKLRVLPDGLRERVSSVTFGNECIEFEEYQDQDLEHFFMQI